MARTQMIDLCSTFLNYPLTCMMVDLKNLTGRIVLERYERELAILQPTCRHYRQYVTSIQFIYGPEAGRTVALADIDQVFKENNHDRPN